MAKAKGTVEINTESCKGCEICVSICPQGSLGMSEELNHMGYRFAKIVNDTCTGCTNCGIVCPDGIIKVFRFKTEAPQK